MNDLNTFSHSTSHQNRSQQRKPSPPANRPLAKRFRENDSDSESLPTNDDSFLGLLYICKLTYAQHMKNFEDVNAKGFVDKALIFVQKTMEKMKKIVKNAPRTAQNFDPLECARALERERSLVIANIPESKEALPSK